MFSRHFVNLILETFSVLLRTLLYLSREYSLKFNNLDIRNVCRIRNINRRLLLISQSCVFHKWGDKTYCTICSIVLFFRFFPSGWGEDNAMYVRVYLLLKTENECFSILSFFIVDIQTKLNVYISKYASDFIFNVFCKICWRTS